MPTYSARCPKCGTEKDYIAKIADRENTPVCCKKKMDRVLTTAMIPAIGISDSFSMKSPIDGKQIYGRSEYLKLIKEHNILPSSELAGEADLRMKEIKAKIDTEKREIVEKVISTNGG